MAKNVIAKRPMMNLCSRCKKQELRTMTVPAMVKTRLGTAAFTT